MQKKHHIFALRLVVGAVTVLGALAAHHASAQLDLDDVQPLVPPAAKTPTAAKEAVETVIMPKSPDVDFCAFDAESGVTFYFLTLKNGGGESDAVLKMWRRGRAFGMGWMEKETFPGYAFPIQAAFGGFYNVPPDAGLTQKGSTLTGAVYRGLGEKYVLDMKVDGKTITGTYRSETYDARDLRSFYKGKTSKAPQPTPGPQGAVRGKTLSEAELKAQLPPVPPEAQYPCWRNKGDGVGFETGAALITDLSQARVLWKSEELIPPGYHEGINFGTNPCGIQSGHASPILVENRIYLSYFTGSAGHAADDQAGYDRFRLRSRHIPDGLVAKKVARVADQIMVCMDARTGKTLWKFVAKEDGPNNSRGGSDSRHGLCGPSSKAASHLTPCYGDGKVFFKGTGGCVYCLDAKTGARIWRTKPWDKRRGSTDTDTCQYAQGVVATKTGSLLAGYDAETGKILWTLTKAVRDRRTHVRWHHRGKDYFITACGRLLEPSTGKVIWEADLPSFPRTGKTGVIAANDRYMVHGAGTGITGFRITAASAEKLWTIKDRGVGRAIHPVLYKGYVYARANMQGTTGGATRRTYCIDAETGKIMGEASGTKSYASVIGGDGRVFNSNAASVFLQHADPKNFRDCHASAEAPKQVVADASMRVVLQGMPETTAIYADGRLWSRTFDGIICYDLRALSEAEGARFRAAGARRVSALARRIREAPDDRLTAVASELLATGSETAAGAVISELQSAARNADDKRFGLILAAVSPSMVRRMPEPLDLVKEILQGKNLQLAKPALLFTGRLRSVAEAAEVKPLVRRLLTERGPEWWEPAAAAMKMLDQSGRSTLKALSSVAGGKKTDKARRRHAAMLLADMCLAVKDKDAARATRLVILPVLEDMVLDGDRAGEARAKLNRLQSLAAPVADDGDEVQDLSIDLDL